MKKILNLLLISIGSLSVFLGILGIVLPLLPTTPFLLLGGVCYLKSSSKLYTWLINNKYLGVYIKNYYEKKGIPLKVKVYALLLMWSSICYSAFSMIDHLSLRVMLLTIASFVTWHIVRQPTLAIRANKKNRVIED